MAMTWGLIIPDISNQAGINALYAADGLFRDPGALGVNMGIDWDVWLAGDHTGFGDQTGHMAWNFNGLLPLENLTSGNAAPVATDDAATTTQNTAVTFDVLLKDVDADADALSITAASVDPAQGAVTIGAAPDYLLTFTPATGFVGNAVVTDTVDDGNGGEDDAIALVDVTGPAPSYNPQTMTVEDTFASQEKAITIPANATGGHFVVIHCAAVRSGGSHTFTIPDDFEVIMQASVASDSPKNVVVGKIIEASDLDRVVDLVSEAPHGDCTQGVILSFDEMPTSFTVLNAENGLNLSFSASQHHR